MARFAGDRSGAVFEPMSLSSGASGGNYSAAAGVVDLGSSFSAMRDKAPRFDQLSAEAMKNQAAETIAGINGMKDVASAGIQSVGQAQSYALNAKGQIKAAEKAADAQKQSSMIGAVGGIIGTGMKLLSGGLAG